MPLTLITGPANAAKAGAVLERLRAALARDPVLVVPTSADAAHYARELAGAGLVFGAEVTTFPRLMRDIAADRRRARAAAGRLARERVVRAAIGDVELRELAASAAGPGFADALGDLFAELQRSLASPGALRARRCARGARPGPRRRTPASSPRSTRPTTAGWRRSGAVDADGLTRAALDALARGVGRPAAVPLRLRRAHAGPADLVETLVRHTDTEVTRRAQLRARPRRAGRQRGDGRAAQAAGARARVARGPLASTTRRARARRAAPPRARAVRARAGARAAQRRRPAARGGRRARRGRARRRSVLELLRDGMAPEDIAVLVRGADADLFAQVFEAYGIPVARDRRAPFAHTRLGTGVLAFARAALGGSGAATSSRGCARRASSPSPDLADRLEVAVRRHEARDARARRAGSGRGSAARTLSELDALAAAAEGVAPFLDALLAEAEAIWTAPARAPRRRAEPEAEADARAARRAAAAVEELTRLAERDPALAGAPQELLEALAGGRGARRRRSRKARPASCSPTRWRSARGASARSSCAGCRRASCRAPAARAVPGRRRAARARDRVRARAPAPRGHARARALAVLRLRLAPGGGAVPLLPQRPTRRAGRSSRRRSSTTSARCSPTSCGSGRGRRLLAEVTWPPAEAPTPHELRRAAGRRASEAPDAGAARPRPRRPRCSRAARRARPRVRARPGDVRRLPGQVADRAPAAPEPVDPDPEAMRRGSLAHAVLERTLRAAARSAPARRGSRRSRCRRRWRSCARRDRRARGRPRARPPARAAARALEVDLERYIRHEAAAGAGYEPRQLEWSFGGEDDAPLMIDGVAVSGRVDRVDTRRRARDRPRLQGPHRLRRGALGRGRPDPGRAVRARRARAARASRSSARSTSRSAPPTSARAASSATTSPGATSTATSATATTLDDAPRGVPRDRRARPPPTCAPAASSRARTAAPTTAAAPTRGSAAPDERAGPPSPRAARGDRGPRRLVAARRQRRLRQDRRDGRADRRRRARGRGRRQRDPRPDLHREGRGRARGAAAAAPDRARRGRARARRRRRLDRHDPRLLRPPAALAAARRRAWTRASRCSRSRPPSASPRPPTSARSRPGRARHGRRRDRPRRLLRPGAARPRPGRLRDACAPAATPARGS